MSDVGPCNDTLNLVTIILMSESYRRQTAISISNSKTVTKIVKDNVLAQKVT